MIEIFCQLGPYAKKYTVLLEKDESFRHSNKVIGFGSFGSIYCCQKSGENTEFVVKCQKFEKNNLSDIRNHVKEFFIYDMMSALQVGPKILRKNGFDFIIFQNCLEFEMEKCDSLRNEHYDQMKKDLKENLLKMHSLQFVHCDIKPANIMMSPTFKKTVFLDFGVSGLIKEPMGEKSLTKFRGTYEFCGE